MLTYELIYDASNGDPDALNMILLYFKPYINTLSTNPVNSDSGSEYRVDVDLRDELISKIINLTLNFNPVPKIPQENKNKNKSDDIF